VACLQSGTRIPKRKGDPRLTPWLLDRAKRGSPVQPRVDFEFLAPLGREAARSAARPLISRRARFSSAGRLGRRDSVPQGNPQRSACGDLAARKRIPLQAPRAWFTGQFPRYPSSVSCRSSRGTRTRGCLTGALQPDLGQGPYARRSRAGSSIRSSRAGSGFAV